MTRSAEIPASLSPGVERVFARTVGDENARTLLDLARKPCRLFGIGPEDTLQYLWEVLSNEIFRFVAGANDYPRLLERVATKTQRYLSRTSALAKSGANLHGDRVTPNSEDVLGTHGETQKQEEMA